ncbi:MAG: protein translocase subunit SecD, partial [Thermodesulfobacteriota bacterium]
MDSIKYRFILVALALVIALALFLPSTPVSDKLPSWWSDRVPKIALGLDLQGGMYLLLKVNRQKAVDNNLERLIENLKRRLKEEKITFDSIDIEGHKVTIYHGEDKKEEIEKIVASEFSTMIWVNNDDGKTFYKLSDGEISRIKDWAVFQALETIRNRIDKFGVREPIIQRQGNDEIVIQLPGLKDPKRAIELIGKTAVLEFKLVDDEQSLKDALAGNMPKGSEIVYKKSVNKETGEVSMIPFLLRKETLLTGDLLTDAKVSIDQQFNEPYVSITFDRVGARIFERITADNVGKRLAIILDDNVYSAPVIQERIGGGRAQISCSFTIDESKDLAIVLRAGALPAPVDIIQNITVGPSLGRDSIEKGVKATIIGAVLVLFFMIFYYKLSGV